MRSGIFSEARWIDEPRLIGYSRILCIFFVVISVAWIGMSHRMLDPNGKPVGTDFLNVWAAGQLVLKGEPAKAYDYPTHFEIERQVMQYPGAVKDMPYFGWHYPPMFLFVATPLGLLPYAAALAVWVFASLMLYLICMRSLLDYKHWMLVSLAFPAVFVNAEHGQNACLTTALLGGGLMLLEKRPILAGMLFGLLSYKPQFGLLLPLALVLGFHWRAILSATVTTIAIAALTYAVFGIETWQAFFESLKITKSYVLEEGNTGWEKIQSVFSAVRMLGGSIDQAYATQSVFSVLMAIAVILVWRKPLSLPVKGSVLAVATIMTTPYVLDYDLVLLALPIGWMAMEGWKKGFLPYEKFAIGLAFVLPLLSRTIGMAGIPLAPPMLLFFLAVILKRALWRQEVGAHDVVMQAAM